MIRVQGFAELEYGMLRYMGAIDDSTPVVTTGKCGLISFLKLIYVLHGVMNMKLRFLFLSWSKGRERFAFEYNCSCFKCFPYSLLSLPIWIEK